MFSMSLLLFSMLEELWCSGLSGRFALPNPQQFDGPGFETSMLIFYLDTIVDTHESQIADFRWYSHLRAHAFVWVA